MFKVNNNNTRTTSIFIVNFNIFFNIFLVLQLLTLNNYMLAGKHVKSIRYVQFARASNELGTNNVSIT